MRILYPLSLWLVATITLRDDDWRFAFASRCRFDGRDIALLFGDFFLQPARGGRRILHSRQFSD
jgi:hypothetical protein